MRSSAATMPSATSLSRSTIRTRSSWWRSWSSGMPTPRWASCPHLRACHLIVNALQAREAVSTQAIAQAAAALSSGIASLAVADLPVVKPLLCAAAQEEREEKLRMVQLYNERLTERERRRDFLRARDLLNMRRMQASITSSRQPRDGCPQHPVCDLALFNWE